MHTTLNTEVRQEDLETLQNLADNGVRHMLIQGRPAVTAHGRCAYRDLLTGCSCILGASMSDESVESLARTSVLYSPVSRAQVLMALSNDGFPLRSFRGVRAAQHMQTYLHDDLKEIISSRTGELCIEEVREKARSIVLQTYKERVPEYYATYGLTIHLDIQVGIGLIAPHLFTDKPTE